MWALRGIGRTKATKLIARKRLRLYPIWDSVVSEVVRTEQANVNDPRRRHRARRHRSRPRPDRPGHSVADVVDREQSVHRDMDFDDYVEAAGPDGT